MFKLESYITPIIMNQVAKYVKNIRPQDAQVSLWEGEVAFQNVDLRLDVLEEELNLPFEFLSGHIHELVINVPWLKIAVEPIVIDINTIEFVLKLKDPNKTTSEQRLKKIESKKEKSDDVINPGLLYNLIHNIVIKCHNIILKYVEDDIVVSMNIQHLTINSANEKWIPAFIDIGSSELLKRKLIKISDLTICLDKRNSDGLIEVCQEPIMYRCTLEIRIINTYKFATKADNSTTRIGIFSKLIEINTSSLQFPMLMRLFNLITTLKEGHLKKNMQTESDDDQLHDSHDVNDNNYSIFSTLWNYLPTITIYFDDETDREAKQKGHILDIGIYIENLKFTLKFSEFITDTFVGTTKKLRYSPIFKIGLNGIYIESVIMNDTHWENRKGGVSGIYMEPLGIYNDNTQDSNYLFYTNLVPNNTYLENSIFDENIQNGFVPTKYITDIKSYQEYFTDLYLKYRSPAIAFDIVSINNNETINVEDITNVKSFIRIIMSSIIIRYNHNVWLGVINDIKELIKAYDYPPYYNVLSENDVQKLQPPTLDDFDCLMNEVPLKMIRCQLQSIRAEIYAKNQTLKEQNGSIPFFSFSVSNINGQLTTPVDPIKLVHTTCQLPDKPLKLINDCYKNYNFSITTFEGGVRTNNSESQNKLIQIPKMSAVFKTLILPDLWKDTTISKIKFQIAVDKLILSFTKPQFLISKHLFGNLIRCNEKCIKTMLKSTALNNLNNINMTLLDNCITNISLDLEKFETKIETKGQIKTIQSLFKNFDEETQTYNSMKTPFFQTSSNDPWFQWKISINDFAPPSSFSVIAVWMNNFTWVIDSNAFDYFQFDDNTLEHTIEKLNENETENTSIHKEEHQPVLRKTSRLSLNSDRTHSKFTRQETIHLSSEKDEAKEILEDPVIDNTNLKNEETLTKLFQIVKTLLIFIEISHGFIYLCSNEATVLPPPFSSLIILPNVICKSALTDGINRYSDFILPVYNKVTKNILPWTCNIKDFSIKCFKSVNTHTFVHDAHTTITVALNYKKEMLLKAEKSTDDISKSKNESKENNTSTGKKKNKPERETISMSLHIDTSPFCIEMTSDIVTIVADNIHMLNELLVKRPKNDSPKMPVHKNLRMMTQLEEGENLKEFLESDNKTYSYNNKKPDIPKMMSSFLIQWTITKVQISLESSPSVKSKLILEMEDLITTIDNRKEFIKFTCKIGSLNTNYYHLNSKQEWIVNNSLKIKMSSDSALSLLNVIITTVSLREFYQKIGMKKVGDVNRSITEIVINMRALDIIIDLDKILEFMPYICAIPLTTPEDKNNYNSITSNAQVKQNVFDNVDNLPMLHFDCKGLTIYMPVQTEKYFCSVIIFKIEEIKISPNLENPLQRTPVRQDIFNKAAELGILNMQGSVIEDRQYEIIFQSMSAATGNWDSINQHMNENSNTIDNFVSTNPAFEWNNQIKKPSLVLRNIFNNFTFIMTIAPSIVFNNILICGKSIEFNCATDLICELTTDQIIFFNCIGIRMKNIYTSMCTRPLLINRLKRQVNDNDTKPINKDKRRNRRAPSATDSGIESMNKSCLSKEIDMPEINFPYTISFVSGIFLIKLFKYIRVENEVTDKKGLKMEAMFKPLISLTVSQPTFIITQTMYDQSIRFSLFDLKINLGKSITPTNEDDLSVVQFSTVVAYTQRGKVCNSGFSPSLINVTIKLTKLKKSEIDIEISKPIIIHISEHIIEHFTKISIILYESILTNACFKLKLKPVHHGPKVEMIRSMFFNADHFNIKTDSIVVKLFKKKFFYVKIALIDIMALLSFTKRPDRFNLKGSINGFYIQTDIKILLHPVGVRINLDLTDQTYSIIPTTIANVRFNVIQVDVGVRNVEQLTRCYQGFTKSLTIAEEQWNTFLENNSEYLNEEMCFETLEEIFLPPVGKKFKFFKDELYQDDLRAGAFQFIEMTTDNILPMPYQIQIIKKDYGIICWRYPQPRKVRNVHIYPVPMASSKPINIKCIMEYYSEVNEQFLHFTDFWLSETETKSIELPKRLITACIWRVVIMQSLVTVNGECFDASEEEEDFSSIQNLKIEEFLGAKNDDKDFILHPKVLVGCTRIDTLFNGSLVPKVQVVVSTDSIRINLQNQQTENSKLPKLFKKYKPTSAVYADQTFISLVILNSKFYGTLFNMNNFNFETNLTFSIECLDYGYLNMLPLCEESNVNAYVSRNGTMDVNIVIDKIKINLCLSILHSLLVSKYHWYDHMYNVSPTKKTILTRFVIINRTNCILLVGQSDTQERIQLNPKACMMYSFQSDYFDQKLNIYLLNEKLKIIGKSLPIFISTHFKIGEEYYLKNVLLDDKYLIIVKVRKLSTTQIAIFIKGQIELLSMVKDEFRLQFRKEITDTSKQMAFISEHVVEADDRLSFIQTITTNDNVSIRLKLRNLNSKGWTGDIPLKPNKTLPWLVKVPVVGSDGFISYWVRIMREDIVEHNSENSDNVMQKILISIWPIFEICSMLTCNLNVTESVTNNTIDISPAGNKYALNVPATHQTVHRIKINNMCSSIVPGKDSFNLSLKSVDWNKFFWYNTDIWGIDGALELFWKIEGSKWPFSDKEEMRVTRKAQYKMPTSVTFKCNKSLPIGCTLSLEIYPWALMINSIGEKIGLKYPEFDETLQIESKNIEMMREVKSYFFIQISNGPGFIDSLPIYLNPDLCKNIPELKRYVLTENNRLSIVINSQNFVYKLSMYWVREKKFKVFVIEPTFVVTNFTNLNLFVTPFCLAEKEVTNRNAITSLNINQIILPNNESTENSIGIPLDYFCDIFAKAYHRDMHTNFIYFVCFKVDRNCEISIPIPLTKIFDRRCFSLQCKDKSIPLSVNLLERNGIYYLNVFDDHHSLVYINNQTRLSFLIAQTHECSSVAEVIPEYEHNHFEWYQIIQPLSELYYTPPTVYNKFPNIQPVLPNLTITLFKEDSKDVFKWSKVISIDKSYEKFIHVVNHGDVKIIVCDKHKTRRLTICYIAQQLEFSVKDLRSRILTTENSDFNMEGIPDVSNSMDNDSIKSNNDHVQLVKSSDSFKCKHQIADKPKSMRIRVFVNEISCNFAINSSSKQYLKKEIIALYIDDLIFDFDMNNRKMGLSINNLQIDNQLYNNGNFDFPVLLCSRDLYKKTINVPSIYEFPNYIDLLESNPMIHVELSFFIDQWEICDIYCSFQPMRAYIEDCYVHYIYKILVEISPNNAVYFNKKKEGTQELSVGTILIPTNIVEQAIYLSEPIKLGSIHIKPMDVLLSVHSSIHLYIALDHSPLQFSSYRKQNILSLPINLGNSVGMHYLSGAIFGAGWVVGSLEMLGSPSGLARSFTIGLRDFVSMPVQGLLRGPWGFLVGITQGSASLIRNVTAGTVNSVTKLAGSVSRNLDHLTLDKEHIERTDALRRSRPQGFTEGFSQGITGLGINILGAVGGIARHTLEAKSPGQVVTGVGKGIFGVLAKPISGAAELVSLTGQGMLHSVGFNSMPKQRYPSALKNNAIAPSDSKIWKLLPHVLVTDQILFKHDVTLIRPEGLKMSAIYLTSTVLACMDMSKNKLEYVLQIGNVNAFFDQNDRTIIHVKYREATANETEEESYTSQRIMKFLRASTSNSDIPDICLESLDDLLTGETEQATKKPQWSFYINEDMGKHLLQYLKVINCKTD